MSLPRKHQAGTKRKLPYLGTLMRGEAADIVPVFRSSASARKQGWFQMAHPSQFKARPLDARCDPRLPEAALAFRRRNTPPLVSPEYLGAINITAWLYQDKHGVQGIQVNPNTTIAELIRKFGPAQTPDAEVGFRSEMHAAEWFRVRPDLQVLQIFSERIPCAKMCAPMLKRYFKGVPWFYYYDRDSWKGPAGEQMKEAGSVLKSVYGL